MTLSQTNSSNNNELNRKKSKSKVWLIAIGCIVLMIAGLIFYNKQFLYLYYLNAKNNHFRTNDKLYAKSRMVNETSEYGSYNLNLYRKVRPLNNDDVDAMQIELWQKALIKKNLSSFSKPYMIECAWTINSDSLCKYKTACIGRYTGSQILDIRIKNKYYPMIFFSITTNKKALVKDYESDYNKAPAGYTFDDGPLYVMAYQVTNKELQTFRKIKMK
jgi:hypothetical protein